MKIPFLRLHPDAVLPVPATPGSAGADLCARLDADVTVAPGETYVVTNGFAAAVPEGYAGLVFARSGLASKNGLAPANKVGVVDSDYRGEWRVPMHNHSGEPQTIRNGQRIAQVVIVPAFAPEFYETDSLDETERGSGGLGSTGS
ncbi:MAG: dUTP diphosphatase [Oscillospiraceae bacterium]|nr:dUTP diphosphatase [Oscillospiraceae bacterium]